MHLLLFIQTLTILYLSANNIGVEGAQYLGEALEKNTVRQNQSLHFYYIHLSLFIQTLTELSLYKNQIGAQGAEYIEKLKKNSKNLKILS
jgi:Ran GTPase-activating protein (RanGAP) involved in mRNA processing and transport